MTIELGRYGFWMMLRTTTPDMAREAETLGYGAIWVGGSPAGDLVGVEALLEATVRIPVVTGIVNMWREEAETAAASYHRVDGNHPERFLLGVGIGHPEATQDYQDPLAKIDDYLDRLDAAGVPRDRMVLAALGPKALRIAAERTAGAHPSLTTPAHTAYAREVMGEGALLAPEHKVILEADPDRAVGREMVSRYLDRVNYRNNLVRSGWSEADFERGGSDTLVDALVFSGTPEQVADGLAAHLDAGADHVGIQVLGGDPMFAYRRLAEVLSLP
ncbi:MAG: TIGR03620 family F420-dependent LLM class oxidoreductase [Acidimicrobiia bacterium]